MVVVLWVWLAVLGASVVGLVHILAIEGHLRWRRRGENRAARELPEPDMMSGVELPVGR